MALVTAASLTITLGIASGANAAGPDADDTAEAIELVAPSVDVLGTERASDGTYSAQFQDHSISAPRTTAGDLKFSIDGGAAIPIGLPDVANGTATAASDGTVVYEGNAVDVAVQALEEGVRVQTVLADTSAPTRFDYDLAGSIPVIAADGSVGFATQAGLVLIQSPWAFDARGVPVSTHYEVNGSTLTQVVDHTREDVVYPVVADPTFITGSNAFFGGRFGAVRFNRNETNQIAAGAGAATAALYVAQKFSAAFGPGVLAAITAADITAAAITGYALGAIAVNRCTEVRLYPNPFGSGRPALYPLYWGC